MITKHKIFFKADSKLPLYLGACFQSILLETLDRELAEELHSGEHGLRPYTNTSYRQDDSFIWEINALNETMSNAIQAKLSGLLQDQYLRSFETTLKYQDKHEFYSTSHKDLFKKFYSREFKENNIVNLKFITPTSIKTEGRYLHYPREDLIIFSLLRKWDDYSSDIKLFDQDLYETIINQFSISSIKNLKSQFVPIDKGKVSGFIGNVDFKIKPSTRQINQLINLLLEYSNFSGIGIKTAIGMGKIITSSVSIKN